MKTAKKCLVIMQPTFIPWAGYFELMLNSEEFVFLDDVQLEKQSWQTRNRLIINGKIHWLSVPVQHDNSKQLICDTKLLIDDIWRKKFLNSFLFNYKKHSFFDDAFEVFDYLINQSESKLSSFNINLIQFIKRRLNITSNTYLSSELAIGGNRTDRLISLCDHFNALEYLSPLGSLEYLQSDGFSNKTNTKLRFQNFSPIAYKQYGSAQFISHLSIIDVIANLGWLNTKKYLMGSYTNE